MSKYNSSIDIEDQPQLIENRDDFEKFLACLLENYRSSNDDWENGTLESFLEGLIGFSRDANGYYKNIEQDVDTEIPTWKLFADILLAARVYE